VLGLAVAYGFAVYSFLNSWSDRGTFGDTFGTLNALFSGFAFAALVIALFMQREELSLQRRELELTRQELQRSAEAQQTVAKLQALAALLVSYERRIAELRVRPMGAFGQDARIGSYEATHRESLHWLHKTLREMGITLPFPEQADF
jgi:hypothetical protein